MQITYFKWDKRATGPLPLEPVIVYTQVQFSPPAGAFAVMVSAAIAVTEDAVPVRHFTCSVEVEADENRDGWRDAMSAALVNTCVQRWKSR